MAERDQRGPSRGKKQEWDNVQKMGQGEGGESAHGSEESEVVTDKKKAISPGESD